MAIARVLGAHGVRGDLKIQQLAPDSCFRKGARVLIADAEYAIARLHGGGKTTLLSIEGVGSREGATALRDEYVQVREDSLPPLPEGDYYQFQLIGLAVRTTDGRDLGTLAEVMTTGGADVYVVRGPLGEVLLPAVAEVISEIDLEARTMTVEPMAGLLPES